MPFSPKFLSITEITCIKLNNKTKFFCDIEYNDKTQPKYKVSQKDEVLESNDDIIDFIINSSKELDIENFIEAIRVIKAQSFSCYFMGGYKPMLMPVCLLSKKTYRLSFLANEMFKWTNHSTFLANEMFKWTNRLTFLYNEMSK